uniref:Helix-turn-helix domain-containing protein n=1 Tax=Globodera rostochiensis TaxID=31243 RepID=A0A914HQA0_GLORO
MIEFWLLILVLFFATNSLDKAEAVKVKLEGTQLKTFDEIFGEGWWDKDKAEEWHKLTLEENFHHQIDRPNTQLGPIEPNSTDQNPPLKESDHTGQIEPNSTDQNPQLKESDHTGQIEPNSTDQNPPLTESDHLPILTFDELFVEEWWDKNEAEDLKMPAPTNFGQNVHRQIDRQNTQIGQIEPNSTDQNPQLKESDHTGQIEPNSTDQNAPLTESDKPPQHEYANIKQKELMKRYYEIKDKKYKINDADIAKMLKIGTRTLYKWKKQFNRQQLDPTSVDGHSVEEIIHL